MRILYERTLDEVCPQYCYGLNKILEIPGTTEGIPVTELVGYLFLDTVRRREPPPCEYRGEPELCGSRAEVISLPDIVRKVGAYGSYNCYGLKRLSCSSAVEGWGAEVFTGCTSLECLDIRIAKGRESCFKDILSEFYQTLSANYRSGPGTFLAEFTFPEFFEESVENTPARIIMREIYGCGHMYRYCLDGGDFRFDKYDRLFPYVKVQEKPELAVCLALCRLYWPHGLREDAEDECQDYVRIHAGEGTKGLIEWRERDILGFVVRSARLGDTEIRKMIDVFARSGDAQFSTLLLDVKHSRLRAAGRNGWEEADLRGGGKWTFELQKQEPSQPKSVRHQIIEIEYTRRIVMAKKTKKQELQEQLTRAFPHIGRDKSEQAEKVFKYCEGYKKFLDAGKTEWERVKEAVKMLKKAGYKPFDPRESYGFGDKVHYVNHGKSLTAVTFGKRPLDQGLRINDAHIDSPGLDLKPNPLYEKEDIAFSKTHYYGGIRKYQWGAIPLAMRGVVVKKDGETVEISIGEDEKKPVLCVTDLLLHLVVKQNKCPLKDGSKGEELNIVADSLLFQDEEVREPVKLLALSLLNEKYRITEKDFFRAEIEMVPAVKARDMGFDISMIGVYGQGDRVCTYTALTAGIDVKKPVHTMVTILADKEEIGSAGNMGLNSDSVFHYVEDLAEQAGVKPREVIRKSLCLSSDVNTAFDPSFPDVCEGRNTSYISKGCVLTKCTRARRKSGSNDASAETTAKVIAIMKEGGVYQQADELGAVDVGGGGTVTQFVAHMDVNTVDLGMPILSMHSLFELASKLDIYNTYKVFKAFYKQSVDDCLDSHEIGGKSPSSRTGMM